MRRYPVRLDHPARTALRSTTIKLDPAAAVMSEILIGNRMGNSTRFAGALMGPRHTVRHRSEIAAGVSQSPGAAWDASARPESALACGYQGECDQTDCSMRSSPCIESSTNRSRVICGIHHRDTFKQFRLCFVGAAPTRRPVTADWFMPSCISRSRRPGRFKLGTRRYPRPWKYILINGDSYLQRARKGC